LRDVAARVAGHHNRKVEQTPSLLRCHGRRESVLSVRSIATFASPPHGSRCVAEVEYVARLNIVTIVSYESFARCSWSASDAKAMIDRVNVYRVIV
jgi:hypothetical protein